MSETWKTELHSVLYASSTLDEKTYMTSLPDEEKTDQQAQRFNRAILRGFQENGVKIEAVSYRHTTKLIPDKIEDDGIEYRYIKGGKGVGKYIKIFVDAYKNSKEFFDKNPNSAFVADGLSVVVCLGGLFAAKRCHVCSYAIVTDVPGVYNAGILAKINMYILRRFDGYIFLTEPMNDLVNKANNPYIVMEGIFYDKKNAGSNSFDVTEIGEISKKTNKMLYAGILDRKYGVQNLIDSLTYLGDDVELFLFGNGDCVDYIKSIAQKDTRLRYYGIKDNSVVQEVEKKMDLLVNPRSKNEEFTKYSFPSKTIEYMSTGIPVLMQRLPGMPQEYEEYIYLYEGDDAKSLAEAIDKLFNYNREEIIQTGIRAQNFIKGQKNSISQIRRVIDFICCC